MEKYKIVFCGMTKEDEPCGEAMVDDAFVEMSSDTNCCNKALKGRFTSCFIYDIKDQLPEGSIAEFGVYKGGITKFMSSCFPDRTVYAFDTFEGMPSEMTSDKDHRKMKVPNIFNDVENVFEYLDEPNIEVKKGLFPDTTIGLEDETFALVHLDVDLYESTLAGLEFFWTRMAEGGVMILDDFEYVNTPGVRMAFDDYFGEDHPEIKTLLKEALSDKSHIASIKKTL